MAGEELWPLLAYAGAVVVLIASILLVSHLLGSRADTRAKNEAFESGVVPAGPAQVRLASHFYLIAVFFVVFDLEAVYLFAWAVAVTEVGWAGFIEATIFVVILLAGLLYLWRLGALDWGTMQRTRRPSQTP